MKRNGHRNIRGVGDLRRVAAGICLLAPAVALLWIPWYARTGPELAGVPFFYWYQFAWVPGASVLLLIAYLLLRRAGPGHPRRSSG